MTSATTLVHWLGSGAPPVQLVAHLRTRGLALASDSERENASPARLTCVGVAVSSLEQFALPGRRVAVLYPDPGAADTLAQSLRARGATVTVLSLDPAALERVAGFDPDVVLVEPADLMGGCWEIVRALWTHPRLRWAPIVLTSPDPLGLGALSAPESDRLCQTIRQLSADYEALLNQAASAPFAGWLGTLGPARTLRALLGSGAPLRVLFESSAHAIEVDVAEHVIKGAREVEAQRPEDALVGPEALACLLSLSQAKLSVKKAESPVLTNVMAPLDEALCAARRFTTSPPAHSRSDSHIPRRELRVANSDGIATVPPPGSGFDASPGVPPLSPKGTSTGRVYSFPAVVPPPPIPQRASVPTAPQAIASPQNPNLDHARQVSSAAALNFTVEPAVLAAAPPKTDPAAELIRQGLHSGIVETMPQLLGETWEPADMSHLLAEPSETDSEPSGSGRHRAHWSAVSTFVQQRTGHVKQWAQKASREASKKPLRILLISALLVFCVCLVVRGYGTDESTKASPESTLRIRVHKLPRESQATTPAEKLEQGIEDGSESQKPAGRRASELVSAGHAMRNEGRLDRAENLYREALKAYPGYPRALTGLTRISLQRGDSENAVRYARALVRATPRQAASHLLLGDAHRAAGNLVAAASAWKAAAKRGDRVAKSRLKVVSARSLSAKATSRAYMKFQGLEVIENGTRGSAN